MPSSGTFWLCWTTNLEFLHDIICILKCNIITQFHSLRKYTTGAVQLMKLNNVQHYSTYYARHICLHCAKILSDAAVIEKMVEQRECFQNGSGWWTKKFPLPLLREGEFKLLRFVSIVITQVGFRGVEEKKSLDLLLGEKPVDLARIQNFCLRFPLPSIYRIQVNLGSLLAAFKSSEVCIVGETQQPLQIYSSLSWFSQQQKLSG